MEPQRNYIEFRRPRGVADAVNATFYFFREELSGLFKALVLIVGPVIVLSAVLTAGEVSTMWSNMFNVEYWLDNETVDYGVGYWIGSLLSMVASFLAVCIFYAYAMLYSDRPGSPIEPKQVWGRVRKLVLPYITTVLWAGLVYVGLAFLNIVPILGTIAWLVIGLYMAPIILLVFPARFERKEGFWAAYARVRKMVKGGWWKAFGLMLVTYVLVFVVSFGASAIVMLAFGLISNFFGTGIVAVVAMVVVSIMSAVWYVLYAIPAVAFTIYYFGLVEDHEGVALEAEIDAMAGSPIDPAVAG